MEALARIRTGRLGDILRMTGMMALAFVAVGLLLLSFGKNTIEAYVEIFKGSLGSTYGLSEVVVKMIPLMLCAVATAIPARMGLLNVWAEGQLHIGAMWATWGALTLGDWPKEVLLPTLVLLGFLGGAAFAFIPAFFRVKAGVNETICTLLLNYVAILIVEHMVHGSWRDPMSFNWPFTREFSDAARLAFYGITRIHSGLWLALGAIVIFYLALKRTRWGYELRIIGDNAEAARRAGIPINRYIILTLCIGGGIAGLAGMAEVCAIQGRLRPGISTGFGYTGFLVSWLALHNPLKIVLMAFLLGVLSLGGDMVQISLELPYAIVNILMALIFFIVLGRLATARKEN